MIIFYERKLINMNEARLSLFPLFPQDSSGFIQQHRLEVAMMVRAAV